MKVKNIILRALRYINRADIIPAAESGELKGEQKEVVDTLVYCFNAVEDELSRYYLPLVTEETFVTASYRVNFSSFAHTPVRIYAVMLNGEDADYTVNTRYISLDTTKTQKDTNTVRVKYAYAPQTQDMSGDSVYGDDCGEKLIAYGISAEYMLLNGEMHLSEAWENRYRQEIDAVQKNCETAKCIPPRRWV